ncbi:MAG: prepilin-type N-terminal cleavage/methylation domain-containing protein [Patescibacteria group bacterium]
MKWRSGFTLLEITIVIGIASLLLTLSSSVVVFSQQSARDSVRKTDVDQIRAALEFYREENQDKTYPTSLGDLDSYLKDVPTDPLPNNYSYYYQREPDNAADYVVGARLERGGPSACGSCGQEQCNYCFGALGLLVEPTPSESPTNTPGEPTPTPTPTPTTGEPTNTPTPTPSVNCSQIGSATYDANLDKYVVTLGSNFSESTWSIVNILDCSPTGGSGSIFTTSCVQLGTSTATVSYGTEQNTCDFSTIP